MLLNEMCPFVRYAQILNLNEKASFDEMVAVDVRLFFVQSGEGKILAGGKEYILEKDDLIIINSGIPYRIFPANESVGYLQINFDYDMSAKAHAAPALPVKKENFKKEMLLSPVVFENAPSLGGVLYLKNMHILQKRLSSIVREYSLRLEFFKEKTSYLLSDCIIDAIRAERAMPTGGETAIQNEVIRYIHENYQLPLTNASIGAFFNYHPNHISTLIKNTTGLPLHKYLIHVRLMKAVSLLQNTSLSVSEIALSCGFCDLAYFSGYFKRVFRVNPSKFRNI